jgi:hypothetical protein
VALIVVLAGCGGSTADSGTLGARSTPRVKDAKGFRCLQSNVDLVGRCPANPNFGKTKAEVRAEAIAKTKAARQARIAKARADRLARIESARVAAVERARIAAANAWHLGYIQQDGNVFWRWRSGLDCDEYALIGCWHVEVITRYGCESYVAVQANEYRGGAIISSLLDNQGYGIPPQTPRIFELDADEEGVTASDLEVECS